VLGSGNEELLIRFIRQPHDNRGQRVGARHRENARPHSGALRWYRLTVQNDDWPECRFQIRSPGLRLIGLDQ
jgi:hypothetical protein